MTILPSNVNLSNQIYLSRDNIRTQIIEYIQHYLELENVDLLKSSFLSFLVNTLSTLTSNLLFYSASTYKEFFLTTAQLPQSVFNLSAFLGYNTREANYSSTNVFITIPLTFDNNRVTFKLAENFKFIAGTIEFLTYYVTDITVINNSSVSIIITQDNNKIYNIPVNIDTTSNIPSFSFLLPVRQYKKVIQEFQIDDDTEPYQFITIDVPLTGKVSTMSVRVRNPGGSSWQIYTEFNSVYLMSDLDYGYVSRTISNGKRLTFGNGIIGIQPLPGSTIEVTTNITEGENGNVIAGSINNGDRIYTFVNNLVKSVEYTVTNISPATGGKDEESMEEIRNNAISNLVTLKRLVSEYDYKHTSEIIGDKSITSKTIPVLKRSDIKTNEIQLFTSIEFGSKTRISKETGLQIVEPVIVPTRNIKYQVPIETLYLPRETQINLDSKTYYTLFDLEIDLINSSASYTYSMHEIENIPVLSTSYGLTYNIIINKLTVKKEGNKGIFELYYSSTESNYEFCTAEIKLLNTLLIFPMTNNKDEKKFEYTFLPYTIFPSENINLEFTIYMPNGNPLSTYTTNITFRKKLSDLMLSNILINYDLEVITIYDIPVIEKTYYDSINKKDFELTILQKIMTSFDFKLHRMLTDFINLKFINTIGPMLNMNINQVTAQDVIDIDIITERTSPALHDRYILGSTEIGLFANKSNQIIQCIDPLTETWHYFIPSTNDIVYVKNRNQKYIYNGNKWIPMNLQIPLELKIEVFKSPTYYYENDLKLINLIKDTLLTEYSKRFGPNITLYRSEIIRTIQQVPGVGYCNLLSPQFDIFFNFNLENLSKQELLEYGPEYIYFDQDSISIMVYS